MPLQLETILALSSPILVMGVLVQISFLTEHKAQIIRPFNPPTGKPYTQTVSSQCSERSHSTAMHNENAPRNAPEG